MINGLLLHSVSYSGSWGQPVLALDDFVDKAADLGFDGVMLMAKRPHLSVLDYGPRECARLRQRIESRGMQKVCIAGYTNFTGDLAHPDIPNREFQIRHIAELARVAHDLGAGTIRVFTGYLEPSDALPAPMGHDRLFPPGSRRSRRRIRCGPRRTESP